MAKILIIHPKDASTADFKQIYKGLSDTCVINSHNRDSIYRSLRDTTAKIVVFCGHGDGFGLLSPSKRNKYLFDARMIHFLYGKVVVYLWCDSNVFMDFHKTTHYHNIQGFSVGMFISEMDECSNCCVRATPAQLAESNRLISGAIREFVTHPQVEIINALEFILERYEADNPIVEFNRHEMK